MKGIINIYKQSKYELKVIYTTNSFKISTFLGFILICYVAFAALYYYIYTLNASQFNSIGENLFFTKCLLFGLFIMLTVELTSSYLGIDSEGEMIIHLKVIENLIENKIYCKFLLGLFWSLVNLCLLSIVYLIFEGNNQYLEFLVVLTPLYMIGSVLPTFSSILFPNFFWLESTDVPTYRNYLAFSCFYSLWFGCSLGLLKVWGSSYYIYYIFMYYFITLVLLIVFIMVSPVIIKKKLYLNERN